MRIVLATAVVLLSFDAASAQSKVLTARSPTCGEVAGQNKSDIDHALAFCSKGIAPGAIVGVIAMDSLVFIKVTKPFAEAIRSDRLQGEQLVKVWMQGWKTVTGRKAVTVQIEWGKVELVRGETTLLSGDRVTFK